MGFSRYVKHIIKHAKHMLELRSLT
uniref:Uncharacterized protein n=1 Tax=Rhizophora mucronata TaxID=61149 RepID=A0A2P2NPD9_RHIMU